MAVSSRRDFLILHKVLRAELRPGLVECFRMLEGQIGIFELVLLDALHEVHVSCSFVLPVNFLPRLSNFLYAFFFLLENAVSIIFLIGHDFLDRVSSLFLLAFLLGHELLLDLAEHLLVLGCFFEALDVFLFQLEGAVVNAVDLQVSTFEIFY